MKKKLNILGRKIPVLAVMMAILIIGTASAALIVNYAVLTGEVTVTNPVTITDGANTAVASGGTGVLTFVEDEAGFTIDNGGDPANVNLVTTLYLGLPTAENMPDDESESNYIVADTEGITITYTLSGVDYPLIGEAGLALSDQVIPIGSGANVIAVVFDADPGLMTGTYTIQVEVNPIT